MAKNNFRLNYFYLNDSKDIIKGLVINDKIVTGYIKYKHVNFNTERANKNGNYNTIHYPFDSFALNKQRNNQYIQEIGSFLPKYDISELTEIKQEETLIKRIADPKDSLQMRLIIEMLEDFKSVRHYSINKFGLDASLQCYLETETSDIDLVVHDEKLYLELHRHIFNNDKYDQFSANIIDRRGSYSSFITSKELVTFESRKISYLYKGVKVSILLIDNIKIPEDIHPTGSLVYISTKPHLYKGLGEPSLIKLSNVTVLYGPDMIKHQELFYLSVLPVRTGFILMRSDELVISGYLYTGVKTNKLYVCQFIWDYCKLFKAHNIALNTCISEDSEDKKIVGHFFENIKL